MAAQECGLLERATDLLLDRRGGTNYTRRVIHQPKWTPQPAPVLWVPPPALLHLQTRWNCHCSGRRLLQQDQKWVAEAVFRGNSKGKLELKDSLQLWYHPPPPTVLYHQAPTPDRFFSHRLLVWMPYRLWKLRLQCTSPACAGHQLCGGGLHRRVRQVLDIDNHYNMVTETLICTRCRSSYLSWGHTVLQQLDLAHRSQFRVILTRKSLFCPHIHLRMSFL
ncbi:uncharacterized protein LOC133138583 [Conger conger]|uniref:uncharacterized protein LOC133138583 n=1 Tax=Conger conger TaxID=82655 RepID=UPI002A5AED9D|nr:uncharacterized protein LOC133138583 [Conger conger]